MENDIWINLPSKDLAKSKAFFLKLGFRINERHSSPGMVSLIVGKPNLIVNLFPTTVFEGFSQHPATDTASSTEVLFSFGASSPAEVDAMANTVAAAGGVLFGKPGGKDGWMYGFGFADVDGHRWNMVYMDVSKIPRPRVES